MRAGKAWRRVVLITLDGVGVGALPDAERYGDAGANTLLHVAESCGGLHLPTLRKLGLGNIQPLPGVARPQTGSSQMRPEPPRPPAETSTVDVPRPAGSSVERA